MYFPTIYKIAQNKTEQNKTKSNNIKVVKIEHTYKQNKKIQDQEKLITKTKRWKKTKLSKIKIK